MGQKAKPQWELYTDEELQGGAERFGLTVAQERQRLRILQSDMLREWPFDLLNFLKARHSNGREFIAFTLITNSVVLWLKQGNSVTVDSTVSMKDDAAIAVAA